MGLEPEKRIGEEKQVREDRNIFMQISSLIPFLAISIRSTVLGQDPYDLGCLFIRSSSLWLCVLKVRVKVPNPEVLLVSMAPCSYTVSLRVVCSLHLSGQRPLGTVQ